MRAFRDQHSSERDYEYLKGQEEDEDLLFFLEKQKNPMIIKEAEALDEQIRQEKLTNNMFSSYKQKREGLQKAMMK